VAAVAAVYVGTSFALTRLAVWAEIDQGAYPYAQEDWLRYQLPHLFLRFAEPGGPDVLVTGPSAAREDVLVGPLERKIPGARVYQGGLSLGTIDDVNVSLDYIAGAYGESALPDVIVVGLTPRFVANEPAERPFLPSLDRYSPWYGVTDGPDGPVLVPKNAAAGAIAWLRFRLTKQSDRYRVALATLALVYVRDARARCAGAAFCPYGWPLAVVERALGVQRLVDLLYLNWVKDVGIERFIEIATAPSKFRFIEPWDDDWLRGMLSKPDTFWRKTYAWDPRENEAATVRRLKRLRGFAERNGIELVAVNLPENDIASAGYVAERYAAYEAVVARGLAGVPYADWRRLLPRDQFRDAVHALPEGAARITDALVVLLESLPEVDRLGDPGEEVP
jgi:hypothetical protein